MIPRESRFINVGLRLPGSAVHRRVFFFQFKWRSPISEIKTFRKRSSFAIHLLFLCPFTVKFDRTRSHQVVILKFLTFTERALYVFPFFLSHLIFSYNSHEILVVWLSYIFKQFSTHIVRADWACIWSISEYLLILHDDLLLDKILVLLSALHLLLDHFVHLFQVFLHLLRLSLFDFFAFPPSIIERGWF